MKKLSRFLLFTLVVGNLFATEGCRGKGPEISIDCQRLSSCFSSYGNLVKDPSVKSLVEAAQRTGQPMECASAITRLESETKQTCPF